MCVCTEGETVQDTSNCSFSIKTFPYTYNCLQHFEFTLRTPLTAETNHRASAAVVMRVTKYAVSR